MKESNRNSRDPEDDTELDLDGIEDNIHPELEILEAPANPELPNQFSQVGENDTDLNIERIVESILHETETVDLVLEQGQQSRIDIVTEQGSQGQIDVVLERRLQSRDTHDGEDRRSHV